MVKHWDQFEEINLINVNDFSRINEFIWKYENIVDL